MGAAVHFLSMTFSTALSQSPLFCIFGLLGHLPQCTSGAACFPVRDSEVSCHQTALIPCFFHLLLSLHPSYLRWLDLQDTCLFSFCSYWNAFTTVLPCCSVLCCFCSSLQSLILLSSFLLLCIFLSFFGFLITLLFLLLATVIWYWRYKAEATCQLRT